MKKYLWLLILLLFVSQFNAGGKAEHGVSLWFTPNEERQYIKMGDGIDFTTTQSITICARIMPVGFGDCDWIYSNGKVGGLDIVSVMLWSSGRVRGLIEDDVAGFANSSDDGYVMSEYNWYDAVVVFDRENDLLIRYIDAVPTGTQDDISVVHGYAISCAGFAYIGAANNLLVGEHFEGYMNEVRIYARALDSAEIAWCYNHPLNIYSTDSLVGWWKMDEFTGTTVYDSSGQANNGIFGEGVEDKSPTWSIETYVKVGKEK